MKTRTLGSLAIVISLIAASLASGAAANAEGATPANDNFAAATEITQLPFTETVDASEASVEPGEETDCNGGTASVWYRFTPDRDMSVNAQANDDITFHTPALAVYTGTSLDALTLITCGTNLGGYFYPQRAEFNATGGNTYYFRASDFGGVPLATFTFDVEEVIRPANDDRSNAQPVGNLPASVNGDNTNATVEPGELQPCGGNTGSVWYSVTTATASDLSLQSVSGIGPVAVYDAGGEFINCGEPFHTVAGGTYLIQVTSYSPGPFNFEVRTYTALAGSISVEPSAKVDRFGKVTVNGTVSCTGDFAVGFNIYVTLQQKVGKQPAAEGIGYSSLYAPGQAICDGRSHAWTVYVSSHTSTAFWSGSMTATPSATILTEPYYFGVDVSGPSSKVSAQRAK